MTGIVEAESELGRLRVNLPIGVVRHLHNGERLKCTGLITRICSHAINSSFRVACVRFNEDFHRFDTSTEIPLMTFTDIAIKEGQRYSSALQQHTDAVLCEHGFTIQGFWPENKPFPEELRNKDLEYIHIDPQKILEESGKALPQSPMFQPGQESKPETGLHPIKPKRREARSLVPDDKREEVLTDYVRYIDTVENRDPLSYILHPFKIEKQADSVVNIFIDGVLVAEQSEHRVHGGKPEARTERTNVKHIDIRVETENGGRYNITAPSIEEAYRQLLAFLLETRLITNYLHFFVDGEKALKTAIDKYFVHWHKAVFLDEFHANEKIDTLTSLGIKNKRVASPWEEPVRYKYDTKNGKKGDIKDQPMTSLSRTYASVIKNAVFYGNLDEAIEYIKHIPKRDITKQESLDELVRYLETRREMITCYALRKKAGLKSSSNSSELCNELIVSSRQKVDDRMHWREKGSSALAALTAMFVNRADTLWFSKRMVSFQLYFTAPTQTRS